MEEVWKSGQVRGIFWTENQQDSLTGWVWSVRQEGVEDDSRGFGLGTWEHGVGIY